jgi:hypothetical protein
MFIELVELEGLERRALQSPCSLSMTKPNLARKYCTTDYDTLADTPLV